MQTGKLPSQSDEPFARAAETQHVASFVLPSGRSPTQLPAVFLVCLCVVLLLPGCAVKRWFSGSPALQSEKESNPQYVTEEDLLEIVSEFQRATGRDTYRFPIPKDVTGANVYKATLIRLRDYETKHPGAYVELVAFTRARAYEKLREYEKAIAQYQIVSQTRHRLGPEAVKSIEILTRFQELKQQPFPATTPLDYLQALDSHIASWQAFRQELAGSPYEMLAHEEEEDLDQAKVTFLALNRRHIEDGNASVVEAYRQLIAKHQDSKNVYQYQIEFGDFYFTLVQEYVAQSDPETLEFDPATFEGLSHSALQLYAQVAQVDGVMEKLEAKGKLEALKAYMAKIQTSM